MTPKLLGFFQLGAETVRLFVGPGNGGSFQTVLDDGGTAVIRVGLDHREWNRCLGVLLHEAIELSFLRNNLRYCPSMDYGGDNGSHFFAMNHTQFSEALSQASVFVSLTIPELCKAYKKHHKSKP